MNLIDFEAVQRALAAPNLLAGGRVTRVAGTTIEAVLPRAQTGAIYRIDSKPGTEGLLAEVVGFTERQAILAPFGEPRGISPGDPLSPEGQTDEQALSSGFLGRVVDALGRPIDRRGPIHAHHRRPLYRAPPSPLDRRLISERMETGVSVLDAMTTIGRGQRIGIFAGAGVGKSTLTGMLARYCTADVIIVALVGERGREVREFVEHQLGEEGLSRTVVVAATGDQAPILRVRAAYLATALGEYFRERGQHVLMFMDSLTRFAHAVREIGLAAGEPPTTKGYPPSTSFSLARLLERAGNSAASGSLTAFYTVLVDGDDLTDPVADTARSILDGHVVLSRRVAEAGIFPAVDVLGSLSRVAVDVISPPHFQLATRARRALARHDEQKDVISVGAYQTGQDPETDRAIQISKKLVDLFRQERTERRGLEHTLTALTAVLGPSTP